MGAPEEDAPLPPSDITVFGANCTLHGLSHIFLPGGVTIRRLLWAAAFSSSLSIFLYQVADRVIEYYQYPHVTILDEMDSPVMYFPAITLCNYNSFRKSQIRRNDIFWMAGLLGVEQGDFDDFMAALGQPTDNSKFFPSKTFNMLEFVQRTSHNIDEMLLDCKYRGKDCGPENFTTSSPGCSKIFTCRHSCADLVLVPQAPIPCPRMRTFSLALEGALPFTQSKHRSSSNETSGVQLGFDVKEGG
ncbi:acid-sensing ion channel 3-like [Acanthopagrus schlegelii]